MLNEIIIDSLKSITPNKYCIIDNIKFNKDGSIIENNKKGYIIRRPNNIKELIYSKRAIKIMNNYGGK